MGHRVMVVYGTRPEAIKLAPLIEAFRADPAFEPRIVVTGQHREMLDQVQRLFGITPDRDLDIHRPGQGLADITTRVLVGVTEALDAERPDAVIVQGDTTSSFAAALAASYARIPVVHVEAGLRSGDRHAPFPEEINRRLTGVLATLHLAPTETNRANLLAEGVDPSTVVVTGNTVVDALHRVVAMRRPYADPRIGSAVEAGRRIVLVTTHRREAWGEPMRRAMGAVARLATAHPELTVVLPMHANPDVRATIRGELGTLANVLLTEPLPYSEFARLLDDATLVLTDSGGVQEEAPGLGTPVLVLRDTTERIEAVDAGTVRLVGTDPARILTEAERLLTDSEAYARMSRAANPYGDGKASGRCVTAIAELLGRTPV